MDDEHDTRQQAMSALGKVLLVALGIGVIAALGALVLVKFAGLDESSDAGPSASAPEAQPPSSLPTVALDVPTTSPTLTDSPTGDASDEPEKKKSSKDLYLSASPVFVKPMERINLTGTYNSADAVTLQVQRREDGKWVDFDATTQVKVGTFATYVMTGRVGDNRFRVVDPNTHKASKPVTVTVQ